MSTFNFSGLNLAMTTPFNEDGGINFPQLEENIESYLSVGIKSFLISSGSGMHVYLTREECDELVTRGSEIINGRAKVIVQASSLLVEDVVDRTRHAAKSGADAVMVLPPFFEGPTRDEDIVRFYATASEGGLPMIGYNVPSQVGVTITPELFQKLVDIPNFISVKDSSGQFAAQTDLIRTGQPVLNGDDPLTLYSLYAGVAGVIWGAANIVPKHCLELLEAAKEGEWGEARELWAKIEPLMSFLAEGDYVQKVYAASEMAGYPAGSPRRPLSSLHSSQREALNNVLVKSNLI